MATPPRPLRLREAKLNAQRRILRTNRRSGRNVLIRTPAGGQLTHDQVNRWLNPSIVNTLQNCEAVVDVYIEQVCYTINRRRNLIERDGNPVANAMRAMLSVPHTFYLQIMPVGGELQGSTTLRQAQISKNEFRQLEYFLIPIILRNHACLIAVSLQHHTIELLDSAPRDSRAKGRIFNVIIRFLIHELGRLPSPRWRFLSSYSPDQMSIVACGNFTCLTAKALAGGQPLDAFTDIGQGATVNSEIGLKDRVIDDLFHQGGWSDLILPLGAETIQQRHAPGGPSELQHLVFTNLPLVLQIAPNDLITMRIVSKLRSNFSKRSLVQWCQAQGNIQNWQGVWIPRMQDYDRWASSNWSRLLFRIEEREEDIQQGRWP